MTRHRVFRPDAVLCLTGGLFVAMSGLVLAQPAPGPVPGSVAALLVTEETATNCADLRGADVTPPVAGDAVGVAWLAVDKATNTVRWWVWFDGLTGAAISAGLHGPAQAGENAALAVDLAGPVAAAGVAPPVQGTATLTAAQIEQIDAGLWYVTIVTAAHPGGEIRGQLTGIPMAEGVRPTDPGVANPEAIAEMMVPGACSLALDHTENPVGVTPPPTP